MPGGQYMNCLRHQGSAARRSIACSTRACKDAGARNAGIPSIAVSFGFLEGAIADLAADAVIDHYDALIPLLEYWPSAT